VAQAYISDYLPTRALPPEWTGSLATGTAGSTSQVYRNAVAQRLNWYRAMAGVPAWVSLDATFNSKAQQGALMLAANNALTHTPPPTWQFYTAAGAEALGNSNVCQGFQSDPACIEQYIADQGTGNGAVGHRRWMLYPQTKLMGTGDVVSGFNLWNALWIRDNNYGGPRPATRDEFVAWPPKGYVPYQVVFPRWSFSFPNANFSGATVTMTRGGSPVPIQLEAVTPNIGDNSIVWVADNRSITDWLVFVNPPSGDTTYNVTISNVVVGGQTRNFAYQVIVFDPGAGPVFTPDPPVLSIPASGADSLHPQQVRMLIDPPTATASPASSAPWLTIRGAPVTVESGTYILYTVLPNSGAARTGTITMGNAVHTVNQAGTGGGGSSSATVSVNRTTVRFGAVAGSTTQMTGPQEVRLTLTGSGAASTVWSAAADQPWLNVSPTGGTGNGKITLSLKPGSIPASGSHTATVTITGGAAPASVAVPLTIYASGATAAPIGVLDTPASSVEPVYGAIGVTGWALDDIEVERVSIWRNPVGNEPTHPNGHIYVGEGVFLEGARPDVGTAFPAYPMGTRAGWGMQVLTNMLPNSNGQPGTGNGTYTLYAYAHDREGKTKLLGSASIVVNNATATRPFGTLDTPANGQEVSGTVTVFGWALTRQPGIIPTDASTIWVYVDGVAVGHPVYNQFRPDIAGLFPGYNNTNGAVGYYQLDTTTLADGLHTIAWSVTDNLGRVEGIGSRLFWVRNASQ
jgi:hypothetical protein